MSLITEFKEKMLLRGLEYFGRYYGAYRGSCYDTADPEGLGRIRVVCPQVYEEESPDIWAWPRGLPAGRGHGLFWVPQPGDPVYITFEGGDANFPLYEHGWWMRDQVPADARPTKPGNIVLRTAAGHQLLFDEQAGTVAITNAAGFRVVLKPDGIELAGKSGRTVGQIAKSTYDEVSRLTVGTPLGPSSVPLNVVAFQKLAAELGAILL